MKYVIFAYHKTLNELIMDTKNLTRAAYLYCSIFMSILLMGCKDEMIEIKKNRAGGRRPLRIKLNIGNYVIKAYYQDSYGMEGVQVQSGKTSYLEFE